MKCYEEKKKKGEKNRTGAAELTLCLYLLQSLRSLRIPLEVPRDARRRVHLSARGTCASRQRRRVQEEFSGTLRAARRPDTLYLAAARRRCLQACLPASCSCLKLKLSVSFKCNFLEFLSWPRTATTPCAATTTTTTFLQTLSHSLLLLRSA